MEASKVTIGGKAARKITLGGATLWEGVKKYAYYFNGSSSTWAKIPSGIKLRGTDEAGSSIAIDFKMLSAGRPMNFVECTESAIKFVWSTGYGYPSIVIPFSTQRLLAQWQIPGDGTARLTVNGEEKGSASADNFLTYIGPYFGCLSQYSAHAKCYIYGVAHNGNWLSLEELDGIEFHNVVRYELDRQGEIIESTAVTLND